MEDIFSINITSDDIINKRFKEVGFGTDGIVLRYNKDYLLKIYRSRLRLLLDPSILLQETKRYEKRKFNSTQADTIIYYEHSKIPDEDIRLHSKEALKRSIERQSKITKTKLPVGALYLDNQFSGSIIKASRGIQIHNLSGLPLSIKRTIMLDVLYSIKELLDNHIYHIDMSNSPHARSLYVEDGIVHSAGHSHVLVNPFTFKTNIIDLDGKSTIYMERFNERYERLSLNGTLTLLLEFLFQLDFSDEELAELDQVSLSNILESITIDEEYKRKIEDETISIDDMISLTKSLH